MNLQEIKNQLASIADYKPSNPAYERDVENIINSNYHNIWNSKPWLFAHKQVYLDIHADITPTRCLVENGNSIIPYLIPVETTTVSPFDINVQAGTLAAVFTAPVNRLTNHMSAFIGNPIEVNGIEYTIVHVEFLDTFITAGSTTYDAKVRIFVDKPFRFTEPTDDWKVKQRYINLPEDTSDVVGVAYRPWPFTGTNPTWQALKPIDIYRDVRAQSNILSNQETSGDAYAYVREVDTSIPAGGLITYTTTTSVGDTSGNFISGDTLEVCWAYVGVSGRVGPLGEPKTISIPTTATTTCHFNLILVHHDGSPVGSPAYDKPQSYAQPDINLKYQKQVFYNANWDWTTKKRLGPPKWLPVSYGAQASVTAFTNPSNYIRWLGNSNACDTEWQTAKNVSSHAIRNKTYLKQQYATKFALYAGAKYERIRLHPRPDSWDAELEAVGNPDSWSDDVTTASYPLDYIQRLTLTYRYTPPDLSFQTDVPELPPEFHNIVVWASLRDLYLKNSNVQMAQIYESRTDKALKDMAKRHINTIDVQYRKGGDVIVNNGFLLNSRIVKVN